MLPQPLILLVFLFFAQGNPSPSSPKQIRSPELTWEMELKKIQFPLPPRSYLVWIPGKRWVAPDQPIHLYHRLLDFDLSLPLPKKGQGLFPPAQVKKWEAQGQEWVEDLLLPHLVQRSAALAPDPGPKKRGLEGLAQRGSKQEMGQVHLRPFLTRKVQNLPPFGFFEKKANGAWVQARLETWGFPLEFQSTQQKKAPWTSKPLEKQKLLEKQWKGYEQLLQKLLNHLRWPLPKLPPGWKRIMLPDDGPDRGGLEEHEALDLGALSLHKDGRLGVWPEGTPVFPPFSEGKKIPAPRQDGRGYGLQLTQGKYRLKVLAFLYHLAPNGKPRLEGFSTRAPLLGWERRDPSARLAGLPKGNHVHLELLGPFRGREDLLKLFLAHRLKRSLLNSPTTGPQRPPALLTGTLPLPWVRERQVLKAIFLQGLEFPKGRFDKQFLERRLRTLLPHLPRKSRLDQLLSEFLPPLLQIRSR